jgi:GTP:adenosylcobinamide-phosphate guanylyltransferase
MAKAFGVAHKCALPVAGIPMLQRVLQALCDAHVRRPILVSIDDASAGQSAAGSLVHHVAMVQSSASAPASAREAVVAAASFPVLVTTGDHALLTPDMVREFCVKATASGADFCAGLATAETILAAYPETKRTFFRLGNDRVSGCNLFAVITPKGLALFDVWHGLEKNRKKPWKLVAAFGLRPLLMFMLGRLGLDAAFSEVSRRLGFRIVPVLMSSGEAAIDVDKPSDHALAEMIIRTRMKNQAKT